MSRPILATGAASGLGLEVSRERLARGWHVNGHSPKSWSSTRTGRIW
ncbi:hypothetical protein [Agromyces ramosus]|uniref:NAD(P)-dependent dehydrogenase (Short-subunit alcohol dehydrogenase family) n=1 Tax=Agromyces ramosus TaxID=33879 RepID=A0ABU0R7I6_9MICO|nr:hypothetical protein [Agromyces ramosus]MDQ0894051.1 NAD(P)-dependent dehydrogenase (short-subunit alcohol dehydrogenase family) [Agromyces ramosus]